MTAQAVSLVSELPSIVETFRRGFASNSSVSSLCAILGGLAMLIAATSLAVRIQRRKQAPPQVDDPQALFEALLQTLKLARSERNVLRRRALNGGLAQPAAALLSPAIFDQMAMAADAMEARRADPPAPSTDEVLLRIRAALFGHGDSSSPIDGGAGAGSSPASAALASARSPSVPAPG
ncbi:MAG: hypothetical protein IT449_08110 [Phycisphaerales bacterium]|nr:hypothetical protein [Phycisphaerales bacterium]